MAHTLSEGPHPDILILDVTGELTSGDIMTNQMLGLDSGRRVYVMVDLSKARPGVPENFLEGIRNGPFVHPNLMHVAVYVKSDLLRALANMIAKLTRQRDKLSLHDSREAALAHLESLVIGG